MKEGVTRIQKTGKLAFVIYWLHKALLKLSPETAHHAVILLLKVYQFVRTIFKPTLPSPSVETQVLGIHIPPSFSFPVSTRLGLAAGFDKQAEVFSALSYLGFGFIEVGTVTPEAQEGNPKPRIWREKDHTLINHLGFNSVGLNRFSQNLKHGLRYPHAPLWANIGKNKNTPEEEAVRDYEKCFEMLEPWVDGFVINLSSPNTPGLRDLQNEKFLGELLKVMPFEKPNFLKLSPDLEEKEFLNLCEFVLREPLTSGLILTNTSVILREKFGYQLGGLSGPPLFEKSLSWVKLAREVFKEKKLIVGVGGISSALDALRMREAGADLVEIYTAFVYQGPEVVKKIRNVL